MTTIWCRDKACAHNVVGKCEAEDIGLMLYDQIDHDGALYCSTFKAEDAERVRKGIEYEDDPMRQDSTLDW